MTQSRILIPLGGLLVLFFVLSNIFHSSDPGAQGLIADVSFFSFLLLVLCFLLIGLMALVRRGQRGR